MIFLIFPRAVWFLDSRGIAWKPLLMSTFRCWNSFWSRQPSFLSVAGRVNEGHSEERKEGSSLRERISDATAPCSVLYSLAFSLPSLSLFLLSCLVSSLLSSLLSCSPPLRRIWCRMHCYIILLLQNRGWCRGTNFFSAPLFHLLHQAVSLQDRCLVCLSSSASRVLSVYLPVVSQSNLDK